MCPRTNLEKDSTEGGVLSGSAVTKQSLNTNQNSAESGVAPAPGGRGGVGGGGGGGAQVQHQLQQWAKYWYSIVWDVLIQSIYKG